MFVIAVDASKNGIERVVVLNAVAHRVIEKQRAKRIEECPWAFPYRGTRVQDDEQQRLAGSAQGSSALHKAKLDKDCLQGFRTLHMHDRRHTFVRRAVASSRVENRAVMCKLRQEFGRRKIGIGPRDPTPQSSGAPGGI